MIPGLHHLVVKAFLGELGLNRVDARRPRFRFRQSIHYSMFKAFWAAVKKILASSFSGSKTRRSNAPCRTAGQLR